MTLRFLDFECSEDADGGHTWEAVASVSAARWPEVLAEARGVLVWAHQAFPAGPGALDDGADWGCAIDARREPDHPLDLWFDAALGQWQGDVRVPEPEAGTTAFHTLTLTLCGHVAFADAFSQRWLGADGAAL